MLRQTAAVSADAEPRVGLDRAIVTVLPRTGVALGIIVSVPAGAFGETLATWLAVLSQMRLPASDNEFGYGRSIAERVLGTL